jgi:hAT family C-terminal dimerisation region
MQLEFPEVSSLALKYVSLPSSTASLERVFSMWQHVHSKSRNRLSKETSEKLIFIYHSLKTMSPDEIQSLYGKN